MRRQLIHSHYVAHNFIHERARLAALLFDAGADEEKAKRSRWSVAREEEIAEGIQ